MGNQSLETKVEGLKKMGDLQRNKDNLVRTIRVMSESVDSS